MSADTPAMPHDDTALPARLEQGEIAVFAPCPFRLPDQADRNFLYQQRLRSSKKNISYDPAADTLSGHYRQSREDERRLHQIFGEFSRAASQWLKKLFPRYAETIRLDRASFRPEEEATRKLRPTARNDVLHIDAFPSRPTQGWRLLRLFVNLNPTEPRVWVTSESFEKILAQYGPQLGLSRAPTETWSTRLQRGILSIFQPGSEKRTAYDDFMLRLHHFLKTNDHFQESAPRRFWRFEPDTAWLVFTDGLAHAELRGRFALEHSFFISPNALAAPEASPAAILEKTTGISPYSRAA